LERNLISSDRSSIVSWQTSVVPNIPNVPEIAGVPQVPNLNQHNYEKVLKETAVVGRLPLDHIPIQWNEV
jgi:hypothetical protein